MKKFLISVLISTIVLSCDTNLFNKKSKPTVKAPPYTSGIPWEVIRNFDQGVTGEVAQGTPDGFDDVAGRSFYDKSPLFQGGGAAKIHINQNTTAFGTWGGVINFPEKIVKGQHLYLSLLIKIPNSFVIDTPGNGSLKFIRLASKDSDGTGKGYIDVQIKDDDLQTNPLETSFRMLREHQAKWFSFGDTNLLTRDVWHKLDLYFYFDDTYKSETEGSRIVVWLNGQKITDERNMQTLLTNQNFFYSLYLFTYWNGSSPKTQHLWVDEIKMSTGTPSWRLETF